VKLSAMNKW